MRRYFDMEGALNNRRLTLRELSTAVAEAAQIVNSRPIARNTGDPETGGAYHSAASATGKGHGGSAQDEV
jgi:hypothetical protein